MRSTIALYVLATVFALLGVFWALMLSYADAFARAVCTVHSRRPGLSILPTTTSKHLDC